jgi:DNA-binding winged helix-turn-helix (wHTH) protein
VNTLAHDGLARPIDLASELPFLLGAMLVTPSLREVSFRSARLNLEPRVMQVLVALARADGATVSRQQLMDGCWDGRVVGENALNQVIARLRRLSEEAGPDGFDLLTVKKVGYRLVRRPGDRTGASQRPAAADPASPQDVGAPKSRRGVLVAGGLVALGGAAIGAGAWYALRPAPARAAAARYVARGREALRRGELDDLRQGVADFRRATELDPKFAEGWGALALGYRELLDATDGRERISLDSRCRAAAERALALDGRNADATVARDLLGVDFGDWTSLERACRSLMARFPDHRFPAAALGHVLADVGRWSEAITLQKGLLARDAEQPRVLTQLAVALWAAARLDEADALLDQAVRAFPGDPALWITKFNVLAFGGRPDAAVAFAEDEVARPSKITVAPLPLSVQCARALHSGAAADRAAALQAIEDTLRAHAIWQGLATLWFCALGEVDRAFALVGPYFFENPVGARLKDVHARLSTAFLFNLPTAPMRADARFHGLTERLGLEAYWRTAAVLPDYRRAR